MKYIKRFLYGVLLVIPFLIFIYICTLIPAIIFIIAVIFMIYIVGSMVDDELKFRKEDKNGFNDWDT